jgi:cell division protein FtsA
LTIQHHCRPGNRHVQSLRRGRRTNADGALNIIGLGQARSRGVRKGEIADQPQAEEDVRNAIVEAEQMADVEIRSVYLGVTGGHIRGFNNRGVHPVVSADREISEDDVQDVIKNAKAINLPAENTSSTPSASIFLWTARTA